MAGEGRKETSSTPDETPTRTNSGTTTAATAEGTVGAVDTSANMELEDSDFRKDGTLRAATAREIRENVPARAAERSFNEVTGKTTVTTSVGGRTVTFEEDGDTRGSEKRERATDSAARAFDRSREADEEE